MQRCSVGLSKKEGLDREAKGVVTCFNKNDFPVLLGPMIVAVEIGGGRVLIKEAAYELRISFCLLYTSPSPRDLSTSRMPSSA